MATVEVPPQDPKTFARYLGVPDNLIKSAGLKCCNIPCPFHDDRNPSMTVYPDHCLCQTRGCGERRGWFSLIDVAMKARNIDFKTACQELQARELTPSEQKNRPEYKPKSSFASNNTKENIETFDKIYEFSTDSFPDFVNKWLEKKQLTDVAKKLGWRWRGNKLLMPYFDPFKDNKLVGLRYREWLKDEHKFDKPKNYPDTVSIPYFTTFRPNSVQFLCEGESDCAAIYSHGCSAIGISGTGQLSSINTILCTCDDLPFVKSVIVCGDNDDAGKTMNEYVMKAAKTFAPRLYISRFKHTLDEKGSDMNDEHVKGLLKLPVQFNANFGDNYKRNYPEMEWFSDYIDDLNKRHYEAKAQGKTIWKKHGNIWVEKNPEEM